MCQGTSKHADMFRRGMYGTFCFSQYQLAVWRKYCFDRCCIVLVPQTVTCVLCFFAVRVLAMGYVRRSFRRAQFILFDLKYLLYVQPTGPWSEELRKSFLSGLESMLQMLSMMHGMDSVVRQVGQHVEFEAEWETGINIQLKLSTLLSMLLEWCELDRDILIRAMRRTLYHLVQADKSCSRNGELTSERFI